MSFLLQHAGIPICYMFQRIIFRVILIFHMFYCFFCKICMCYWENFCSHLHCFVLPYIYLYSIIHLFYVTVYIYICYLYYPIFIQVFLSVTYNILFPRIVPATNTHIIYVRSIYVLLIPTFGTSNSL